MIIEQLTQAGLSEKEAAVYEKLLELGPSAVGKLIKILPYKRGDLYNILYSLRDKKLLSEELKKGVMTFTLENPEKLEELVHSERDALKNKEKAISALTPHLQSLYNLSLQKPGVRFYEGEEGVWKVLNDTLAYQELASFADLDSIVQHIDEINKRYVKKRAQLGIKKQSIALDTPFAREYLKNYFKDVTQTKLIPFPVSLFGTVMHIYGNKVSYITLSETTKIGVIIEDALIFQMHRAIFSYLWDTTPGVVL